VYAATLISKFLELLGESVEESQQNTRFGYLAEVEKLREAAAVADLLGGWEGALYRTQAEIKISQGLMKAGDLAAAARTACSGLLAARASYSTTLIVMALSACGAVAKRAPDEMARAVRESPKEPERLGSSPYLDGLDLSQASWVHPPTTKTALSRLHVAYGEAAVNICDAALAVVGGRGCLAALAADDNQIPSVPIETNARGSLGGYLREVGELQRGLALTRQAVALLRQRVNPMPGCEPLLAKYMLAFQLSNLGAALEANGSAGMTEAEACLREALTLCEETNDVYVKQNVLSNLIALFGEPGSSMEPAEANAFLAQLNQLYAQTGRSPQTSCTICLEPLEQPAGADDSADDGGRGADRLATSSVRVMGCGHQFHCGCIRTWYRAQSSKRGCPICKK